MRQVLSVLAGGQPAFPRWVVRRNDGLYFAGDGNWVPRPQGALLYANGQEAEQDMREQRAILQQEDTDNDIE